MVPYANVRNFIRDKRDLAASGTPNDIDSTIFDVAKDTVHFPLACLLACLLMKFRVRIGHR
ncbi:hypothetical protein CPT32_27045 [Rhizobium sophoriradicis]|nr:hypothetical protein CPT32_27045 [Rhizobium sophoriradicis]PDS73633.1 hypothetical protein CO667_31910 [Rhizobium sp. L43]